MSFCVEMTKKMQLVNWQFKASEVDSLRVLIYFVFYLLAVCAVHC